MLAFGRRKRLHISELSMESPWWSRRNFGLMLLLGPTAGYSAVRHHRFRFIDFKYSSTAAA